MSWYKRKLALWLKMRTNLSISHKRRIADRLLCLKM
jgi:hypothetical protein